MYTGNKQRKSDIDFHKADFDEKQRFLEDLLSNYVKTGFLMLFCESQYCTENIRFVVDVDKYKMLFLNDRVAWPSWKETDALGDDKELTHQLDEGRIKVIEAQLADINSKYLSSTSEYEICMPTSVFRNTERRMKEYQYYGPTIFDEALVDPKITMLKDVLPRFVTSSYYEDMVYFTSKSLPHYTSLDLPLPEDVQNTSASNKRRIRNELSKLLSDVDVIDYCSDDINNYFLDPLLYTVFLRYLRRIVCSENLLTVRAIDMYTTMYDNFIKHVGVIAKTAELLSVRSALETDYALCYTCPPTVSPNETTPAPIKGNHPIPKVDIFFGEISKDAVLCMAWRIFYYFVCQGAPFECGGISAELYQTVCMRMARPSRDMFREVRACGMVSLDACFNNFKDTREFEVLVELVLKRSKDQAFKSRAFTSIKQKKADGCLPIL